MRHLRERVVLDVVEDVHDAGGDRIAGAARIGSLVSLPKESFRIRIVEIRQWSSPCPLVTTVSARRRSPRDVPLPRQNRLENPSGTGALRVRPLACPPSEPE